jgi:uncharacterized membrane protein YphA (DoxX/SURF4 family)
MIPSQVRIQYFLSQTLLKNSEAFVTADAWLSLFGGTKQYLQVLPLTSVLSLICRMLQFGREHVFAQHLYTVPEGTLGGALLIVGLLSRASGLLLAVEMLVAFLRVNSPSGPVTKIQGYELSMMLAAASLSITAFGGDFSLTRVISRLRSANCRIVHCGSMRHRATARQPVSQRLAMRAYVRNGPLSTTTWVYLSDLQVSVSSLCGIFLKNAIQCRDKQVGIRC